MDAEAKLNAAKHNMQTAGQMVAEAEQIAGIMKSLDAIVDDLLKNDWKGSDALDFGRRCQGRVEALGKVRNELHACARLLQDEAKRLHAEAAI